MNLSILLVLLLNIKYFYAVSLFVPPESQQSDSIEIKLQKQLINVLNSEDFDNSIIQNVKSSFLNKLKNQQLEDLVEKRIFNDDSKDSQKDKGTFFRRPCPSYLLSCYFYG